MNDDRVNILIIGGGFAGVECARILARRQDVHVTLVSDTDHMEYYPAVFRVFSSKDTTVASIPLVDIVPPQVTIIRDKVVDISAEDKRVTCSSGKQYQGDYIVVASGSESAFYNIPGVSEFAFPFRSSADVLAVRAHIDQLFTKCAASPADEQLVAFRFVVVGGGPAGCEIAAGVAYHAHQSAHRFGVPHDVVSVVLLEGRERILPMFSERFSEAVSHRLRKLGVQIMPYRRLVENKTWTAILQDMQMGTRTVIWTAGVQSSTLVRELDLPKNTRGRLQVDQFLRAVGSENVYVVGDNADTPQSGLAQTAIHDGAFVATHIMAILDGTTIDPYKPASVSHIVPLHRWEGVVSIGGRVFAGALGWIARAFADGMYLLPRTGLVKTCARMVQSL